ncbi:MAG TPA: hypothetical protein VGK19_24940 [Capsulimonadaceae bacterium]|jgi:hypothetical protein
MTQLSPSQIAKKVGGADDPARLYPVRLYALDKLLGLDLERWLDTLILQPLKTISPPDCWEVSFRFDTENFGRHEVIVPTDETAYVTQFVSDLGVFGLQEAVAYLGNVPFTANGFMLIAVSIGLCNNLRHLYRANQADLIASDDSEIHRAMAIAAFMHGERFPDPRDVKDVAARHRLLRTVAEATYRFAEGNYDEWLIEMIKAVGCSQEEYFSGAYIAEFIRLLGSDWEAELEEVFASFDSQREPSSSPCLIPQLDLFDE